MKRPEFLVDTNIIIDVLRSRNAAPEWIARNHSRIVIPSIVVAELLRKVDLSKKQRKAIWDLVNRFQFVDPNPSDWSRVRSTLRGWNTQNKVPDVADVVIAQTAIGTKLRVATKNGIDFENINGCEWFEPYE